MHSIEHLSNQLASDIPIPSNLQARSSETYSSGRLPVSLQRFLGARSRVLAVSCAPRNSPPVPHVASSSSSVIVEAHRSIPFYVLRSQKRHRLAQWISSMHLPRFDAGLRAPNAIAARLSESRKLNVHPVMRNNCSFLSWQSTRNSPLDSQIACGYCRR